MTANLCVMDTPFDAVKKARTRRAKVAEPIPDYLQVLK
jgi:hypothetical protein